MAVLTLNFSARNHNPAGLSGLLSRGDYIEQIFSQAQSEATQNEPSLVRGYAFSSDITQIRKLTGLSPVESAPALSGKTGLFYVRYIVTNPNIRE